MRPPNVVVVVLDDLGFADLGCFGSHVATPNIDGLAQNGLRFQSFHVTALCSPTRACLLTGRNHHAVGFGFLPDLPGPYAGYSGRMPRSAGTLPRLLRDAGYNTFALGKWHLTPRDEVSPAGPFDRWPLGMGFDRYYGFLKGAANQWTPDLVRDNGFVAPPSSPDDGYHLTEDLASEAIRLVREQQQARPDRPFFLYFATGAVHWPHQVPADYVERYRGRFDEGWDVLRDRTFRRQLALGVVPEHTTLTERPPWVTGWGELSSDERRLFSRQMEVYAGFLEHTDAQIGRVTDFLAGAGLLEDTLVLLVSDNGASAEGGPNGFLTGVGNDDVASMVGRLDDLGGFRAWNHYAWGWAWAGNTPFRLWKRYAWLGGVRTPLIAHWPAGIPSESEGQVRGQFCHAIDVMPTILDAAGVEAPAMLDGMAQRPLDGRSLLPAFADGASPSPRTRQYFEVLGSRAVYADGWKATTNHVDDLVPKERELVAGSHEFHSDRWSLFHLADDFSEAHDVAAEHPRRLQEMIEHWWLEAGSNQVEPLMSGTERLAAVAPPASRPHEYEHRVGDGPVETASPFVAGFELAADIELPEVRNGSGIVCAQGDWNVGWACYLLDGRVVVALNLDGTPERLTTGPLHPGRHTLRVAYAPGAAVGQDGTAVVAVDDHEPYVERVPDRLSAQARTVFAGRLLVGRDRGFPVCDDYQPPFPFTGIVHHLTLRLPTGKPHGVHERLASALRHD